MTYTVFKKINNQTYKYLQRTWRGAGGKVHTESVYVGKASDEEITSIATKNKTKIEELVSQEIKETLQQIGRSTHAEVKEKIKETPKETSSSSHNTTKKEKKSKPVFQAKIVTSLDLIDYKISTLSLEQAQKNMMHTLHTIGLDSSSLKSIHITQGSKIEIKKPFFKRDRIIVTLPKDKKGTRIKFKHAFNKAVAIIALDLIKKQRPESFLYIAQTFDGSFKNTHQAITQIIMNTSDPNRYYKSMVLKWFGNISYLKKLKKLNTPTPEELGVVDLSEKILHWQDQYASIMSLIQTKRYQQVVIQRQDTLQKSLQTERRAFLALQWAKQNKKGIKSSYNRYQRNIGKRQAQESFIQQLKILNTVFKWQS